MFDCQNLSSFQKKVLSGSIAASYEVHTSTALLSRLNLSLQLLKSFWSVWKISGSIDETFDSRENNVLNEVSANRFCPAIFFHCLTCDRLFCSYSRAPPTEFRTLRSDRPIIFRFWNLKFANFFCSFKKQLGLWFKFFEPSLCHTSCMIQPDLVRNYRPRNRNHFKKHQMGHLKW